MTTWRPDLASLRLFVAVCEEASIAKAAEREAIVPSAISKRIADIEAAIGIELLIRGGRGVKPTPTGEALLHHARRVLLAAERMTAELAQHAKGVRGHVRVYANISSISEFLPGDISSFLAEHPGIRVDLQERVSVQIVEGVRDGEVDVGVCLGSVDLQGLQRLPYGWDDLVLVTPADHPLAGRPSVRFEDVIPLELVGLQTASRMTTFLSGLAAQRGAVLNYCSYVGTYEAACRVVAENLGVAVLAAQATVLVRNALGLRAVAIDEPWARRELVLCVRDEAALQPPARGFVEHLRARGARRAAAGGQSGSGA